MCTCKYFWLKVWLSFGPSPSRVRPSLSAQMASVECTCRGCPHCQSWINTTVLGHTYRTCEQPVAKKLCHYGTLCKKCLEEADARANAAGAEGQARASGIGQPHQGSAESSGPPSVGPGLEAQVQSPLKRVDAQEARIEQLERQLSRPWAQAPWWDANPVEGQAGGADAASSSQHAGSDGPPGGAAAAEWQHRPGTNEQPCAAAAAEPSGSSAAAVPWHHQGWDGQPAEASAAEGQHGEGAAAEPRTRWGSRGPWDRP